MSRFTRFCVGRSVGERRRRRPLPRHRRDRVRRACGRGLAAQTGSDELDGRRVGVIGLGKVGGALADQARRGRRATWSAATSTRRAASASPPSTAIVDRAVRRGDPRRRAGRARALRRRRPDRRRPGALARRARRRRRGQQPARRTAASPRTLAGRDILYVPDFLANCGGLIHVACEWSGGGAGRSERARIEHAMDRLDDAIATAADRGRHAARGRRAPGARAGRGGQARAWRCDDRLDNALVSSRSRLAAPSRRPSSRSPSRSRAASCTPATACPPSASSPRRCGSAGRPCARRSRR